LAAEYTANRLSRFNSAEKINEFLNSAEGAYLREFPQLQAKVRQYADTFARNEQKVEKSLAGAKALEQRAGTIAERRQTAEQRLTADTAQNRAYIENSLANIRNAPTERLGAQAESYFKGLRERGLISTADESRYIAQVRDINERIQDRAAARKSLINLGILAAGAVGINYAAGYLTNRFLGGL
jgi:glycyl-tRNA synthetase alpha subunit